MRVLICGSRDWTDQEIINLLVGSFPNDTVVIEGGARGADVMAREAVYKRGLKVEEYPADWGKYGKAAGPIRNAQMLDQGKPDLVMAFRLDGPSKGTDNMIQLARDASVPVAIIPGTRPKE